MGMKKELSVVCIAILLVTIYLSGCTENNDTGPLSNLAWSNAEYGIGFDPPAGWDEDTTDYGVFPIVIFFGPRLQGYTYFVLSLSIYILGPLKENETLESIVEMQNVDPQDTLVYSEAKTVNGMNAYERIIKQTTEISSETIITLSRHMYVEKNRELYIISYIALEEVYLTYKPVVDNSIETFTVI